VEVPASGKRRESARGSARPVAAIAMSLLFLVSISGAAVMGTLNGNITWTDADRTLFVAFASYMAVGVLITLQARGNSVGWVCVGVGLLSATGYCAQEYAEYGLVTDPGSVPAPIAAAWYANWYWLPLIVLASVVTMYLFPTGRVLSPRWRPALWLLLALLVAVSVMAALNPEIALQDEDFTVANPIGVAAVGNVEEGVVGGVLSGLAFASLIAALISQVIRFRRSRGDERQQLKWFTMSAAMVVVMIVLGEVVLSKIAALEPLGDALFGLILSLLPISIGIAILKYRLYDIDVVVNRTLVYGALTATLVGTYVALVFVLQRLLAPLTAQSDLAIAGSTLAVAALFRPARARIQRFIDRRFYRSKYDAQRTLESFTERLRDEIDLEALTSHLRNVVAMTVQPQTVSLWFRASDGKR
jgi:hypothetical protein